MSQETKKIAIVTGSAQGIGEAIAKRLVNEGLHVIVADYNEEKGRKVVDQLGNAVFFKCNVSVEKSVLSLFNLVKERYNRLDVLVNNAGIIRDSPIWKMSEEDFDGVIDINLKGSWLMAREAAKLMRDQKFGRIINISSRGWLGNFGQTNYAASKGGIVSLTRVLALELGKYNVLVNAIAPGLIDTPMVQSMSEKDRERLKAAQPTKQLGKVEDIANAVSFLASEKTEFITGQIIYVDGGKSIGAGV